jgi:DNA-binding NtrC family response regulator
MGNPFESYPRIFVVDDELSIAQMLSVVLQMNLFNATPYANPGAALEAARTSPPDYLLSDIVMPEMNGIELAIAIRSEVPNCKILLFTGHLGASELISEAKKVGQVFSLIEKPIHPTELVATIRSL